MTLKKLFALPVIIILAIIIASIYGIMHDHFTYTVSPEYYIKFKFLQFGLVSDPAEGMQNPRLLVTLTGIIATWWMGLFIGIIFGLVALTKKTSGLMLGTSVKAIGITMVITIVTGLAGLGYGWMTREDNKVHLQNWYETATVEDTGAFHAVGCMHNFSYLGGAIGLIVGITYILGGRPFLKYKKTKST